MPPTTHQQRQLRFEGQVQGVGFRYTTKQIASKHPVVGYVENLDNGAVSLVIEGPAESIDAVLSEVRQHFDGYIQSEDEQQGPASGQFAQFEIRRH